jgi:PmbA protein
MSRLERVLAGSPADRTEISWVELRHGREDTRQRRDGTERASRTVVVRVWERGRAGSHRTGVEAVSELAAAVREALGEARLAPPAGYRPPLPAAPAPAAPALSPGALFDPAIAALDAAGARELLRGWTERGEAAQLAWAEGTVCVAASDGRRAAVRATAAALAAARGQGPAAGRAAAAARSLAALDAPAVLARARGREAGAEAPGEPPAALCPLLLAPEAAAALLGLANRTLFASTAYRDGSSPLRGNLGAALFDPAITLADDGTDPRGLPFPFDLAGTPKRPVELVGEGFARTTAVDEPLAAELGQPATPHALSADEGLPTNLFLRPGRRSEEELRREVGEAGGVEVGAIDAIELYDPAGLRFRARATGVRRIAAGALAPDAEALPDLWWEDRLPDALARVIGVADRPLVLGPAEPLLLLLGGISTPALAVDLRGRAAALQPARG